MQPKCSASLILFSLLLALAMVGCTPPPPSEGESRGQLAGKTVRVACPEGLPAAVVRTYSKTWASKENVTVEVVKYDPEVGPKQAGTTDIWVMQPRVMPKKAAAGLLQTLPTSIIGLDSSFGWTDLLPLYRDRLVLWENSRHIVPLAVPLLGESPLCIYRSDWVDDPIRAAAFQKKFNRKLAPPTTWEQFADLAEFFRDTAPGGAAPSLPPLPADDEGLDRAFFAIAACYARRAMSPDEPQRPDRNQQLFSFQYDHDTGKPRLNSPGFVHALNLLKRLQKCRVTGTSHNPAEAFRDGHVALGLADVRIVSELQKMHGLSDRLGVCRIPGGDRWFEYDSGKPVFTPDGNQVPYLGDGGWLAAVPLGAATPDAAFALLADLAGKERGGQIMLDPLWGGAPTRQGQLERSRWDAFGFDAERTRSLKEVVRQTVLHPAVQNPAIHLRTSDEATHEAVLLKEIRAFLTSDGGDAAKVLANAAKQWEELDKTREGNAALEDYRLSVGLLPRSVR
jgi:multiple sugar transport system substrate-binding protein